MSEENPMEAIIRQLEYDVQEMKADAGLVQNDEIRVHILAMIEEKRKLILAVVKEYGEIAGG